MNILLTRLDRVGDLILSTPAIASVRRSWPGARITLACSSYNAVVVERNADIDGVVVVPPGCAPATVGERFRGACDLAIALAPCVPDFHLVGATRAPVRVGYTYVRRYLVRLTASRFLTKLAVSEADPELSERDPSRVVRHEVEQVLDLVRLAGGTELVADLNMPIDDVDRRAVGHVPADGIAFHLGARWFRDGSSIAGTLELLRQLRAYGLPLVVTYGIDALEQAAAVREAGVADAVVGSLSFYQWAAVFEKSRLVVTVDTGATHVASATRRPAVVVFEHRYYNLSSQEWAPYAVPAVCLRKPESDDAAHLASLRSAVVDAVGRLLGATVALTKRA